MYFKAPGQEPIPLQGSEMQSEEIEKWVAHIAAQPHDLSNRFVISQTEASAIALYTTAAPDNIPTRRELKEQELANTIFWTLGRTRISAEQIKRCFHMGNRAYDVADELCGMTLISEKFANQPRTVFPTSIDDIPIEVMELLARHGFTKDYVAAAISARCAMDEN
jgi:DNA segregation ATPase FtsK/SpoIIIE-like protein